MCRFLCISCQVRIWLFAGVYVHGYIFCFWSTIASHRVLFGDQLQRNLPGAVATTTTNAICIRGSNDNSDAHDDAAGGHLPQVRAPPRSHQVSGPRLNESSASDAETNACRYKTHTQRLANSPKHRYLHTSTNTHQSRDCRRIPPELAFGRHRLRRQIRHRVEPEQSAQAVEGPFTSVFKGEVVENSNESGSELGPLVGLDVEQI